MLYEQGQIIEVEIIVLLYSLEGTNLGDNLHLLNIILLFLELKDSYSL